MSEVKVSLGSIIGNKYFTMLNRIHGAWVDIDIWIKLLHSY